MPDDPLPSHRCSFLGPLRLQCWGLWLASQPSLWVSGRCRHWLGSFGLDLRLCSTLIGDPRLGSLALSDPLCKSSVFASVGSVFSIWICGFDRRPLCSLGLDLWLWVVLLVGSLVGLLVSGLGFLFLTFIYKKFGLIHEDFCVESRNWSDLNLIVILKSSARKSKGD